MTDPTQRLFDAYAAEVAQVDANGDGVLELRRGRRRGRPPTAGSRTSGCTCRRREFKRFAVTREIDDGLLAPRFAPSQRAWVLSGIIAAVAPAVAASVGRDGDDR